LYFLYCFQYFSFRLSVLVLLLSFHANSKPPQIGLICTKNIIIYKNILYQSKLFLFILLVKSIFWHFLVIHMNRAATSRFKRNSFPHVCVFDKLDARIHGYCIVGHKKVDCIIYIFQFLMIAVFVGVDLIDATSIYKNILYQSKLFLQLILKKEDNSSIAREEDDHQSMHIELCNATINLDWSLVFTQ
ncbi:hypothetical protein ACJX0J_012588, partial [Zea mays]